MGIPQAAAAQPRRRSDAGQLRFQQRDLDGLLLVADHYAAPYDLLAQALGAPPYLDDIFPSLPPALKARLFAAVDLSFLWNKTGGQVTITDATLAALPAILDPTPTKTASTTPTASTTLDHWRNTLY
jgi:hypothetical protein